MPGTLFHHFVTYMELHYSWRRLSSTKLVLRYTIQQLKTTHLTAVDDIGFFFRMLERGRLEICWRYIMKTKNYSRTPGGPLLDPH